MVAVDLVVAVVELAVVVSGLAVVLGATRGAYLELSGVRYVPSPTIPFPVV